jgi:hypothetical protein
LCLALSLGGTPGEGILMRPSGPCSLNRITQSRRPGTVALGRAGRAAAFARRE